MNMFSYDNIPLHLPGEPTVYTVVRWEKSVTNMKHIADRADSE